MTLHVFLGPSLARERAEAILPDARFLPPVAHGDVLRAVSRGGARRLAIVDGYFRDRPSVWHKEILWAIDRGVEVWGAASMGALRAAELADFGMRGVGEVYRGFLGGRLPPFDGLSDDDEVAVVHGPAGTGYLPVTVALVDIRHTLAAAGRAGLLDEATRARLLALARTRHFSERDYRRLLADAADAGLDRAVLGGLERWLPKGRIERKRLDTVALLERLAEASAADDGEHPASTSVTTSTGVSGSLREAASGGGRDGPSVPDAAPGATPFEPTEMFERALRTVLGGAADAADADDDGGGDDRGGGKSGTAATPVAVVPDPLDEAVIDELRLDPERYRRCKLEALVALGRMSRRDAGVVADVDRPDAVAVIGTASTAEATAPDGRALRAAADELRRREGLFERAAIARWLDERELSLAGFDALVAGEARLHAALATSDDAMLVAAMLDRLRVAGDYAALRARAAGRPRARDERFGPERGERALRDHFERRLGRAPPADPDAWARGLGLADAEALKRLLLRVGDGGERSGGG